MAQLLLNGAGVAAILEQVWWRNLCTLICFTNFGYLSDALLSPLYAYFQDAVPSDEPKPF